jgi:hypothetical protein
MIEWYIPWNQIDAGLKVQLVLWIAAVALSYWIFWRSLVRRRPWLTRRDRSSRRRRE